MLWLLPLRSLWRNRRRALLSIAIIALGTALSLFVLGFLENARTQIVAASVDEYGNYQIASPLLWDDSSDGYEYLLAPDHVDAITTASSQQAAYLGSTSQLQFSGLLASGDRTQVVRVTGLQPENGILDFGNLVTRGRPLETTDVAGILIGRSLADRLSLDVGDFATLTLTTVDGAYNASPLQIIGIFAFSSEQVELRTLILPLPFAQLLLNTRGVDRVVVSLDKIAASDAAAASTQDDLESQGLALEARTWDELSPFFKQLSSYFDALFGFLTLAVSILVFFIILQVLTLAFLERTREIGTLRALGTTRGEIFRLFFSESGWLAVIGSGLGVLGGLLLGIVFNAVGIEWLPPGTVEESTLAVSIGPSTMVLPFTVSVVATLLSAFYPAIQAARLQVVDALRVD